MFAGGPEWLGRINSTARYRLMRWLADRSSIASGYAAAVGGSFFNNQRALRRSSAGHIDLNRSAHWFRITPDALYTRYGINYGNQARILTEFRISVGAEYKFKAKRDRGAPEKLPGRAPGVETESILQHVRQIKPRPDTEPSRIPLV